MNKLRIIFMGTPEFAVPSLNILVENGFEVVGVITAPDKPSGRGQQLSKSDVKIAAEKHGLRILQPVSLKAPEFIEELRSLNANLQVVVAFRMLPEVVWTMPALGTFNLHGSLLPQYRGAAPINWAIINGEKETGVTTFFLKHEIDTGSILFQEKEPISPEDNVGSVYERLMIKGAGLVLKTVKAIEAGNYESVAQNEGGELKHAPKLFRETCEIKWNNDSESIVNFIRGLSPYPAAWTTLKGKTYKIFKASKVDRELINLSDVTSESFNFLTIPKSESGYIDTDNKTYLHVATENGFVSLEDIQPEGKKRMKVKDFFLGNKL